MPFRIPVRARLFALVCLYANASLHAPAASAQPAPEAVALGGVNVPRGLVEAVVRAAQETGVDPAFLMALADKESSLLPDSQARTSSAEGLFQFLYAS